MQTAIDYKYLNFIQLVSIDSWSTYALLGKGMLYTQKYPFVKIGDFLSRNKTQVKIQDGVLYKRPTIRMNANGISLRDEVDGKEIGTKNQFRINERQFLLSKIDARNGAFGVVPKELDNGIITGNFWTFEVDYSIINPHYLTLLTGTKEFQKLSQSASVGTTNRNYLQEDSFLNFKIPLPTLTEQEAIVNAHQSKIQEAQILEQQAQELEGEIEKYFLIKLGLAKNKQSSNKKVGLDFIEFSELAKWSIDHFNKRSKGIDISKTTFKTLPIKNLLLFFEGGKTPSKSRKDFWSGDVFWTSPKDFTNKTILDTAIDTISKTALKEAGVKLFPKGTLLSVFRSGILRHSFPTVITEIETTINQDLKAYSLKEELIDKFYYLYFVNVFKEYVLLNASKKSVTVESINTEDFLELRIVLPPLEVQRDIVVHIESLNSEIKNLNRVSENLKQQAHEEFEQAIFS